MWATIQLYFLEVLCTLICVFIIRIFIVYLRIHQPNKLVARPKSKTVKIMIVLGSGGHTFEMLRLINNLGERYRPRIYVIANSDSMSEAKVLSSEGFEEQSQANPAVFEIEKIPRSREVNQSWISSFLSAIYSSLCSFPMVLRHMPDVILCNGPGTCVPACLSAYVLHVLGMKHIKCIFVESLCRVNTMSLSGKIMDFIADDILVQWPQLKEKYPRSKYFGKLI